MKTATSKERLILSSVGLRLFSTVATFIVSRDGYVTAPSTDKGKKYGYVFYDCKLTAEPEATKVYLSRPWRPYAQAVFIRCELGKHILPVGWNNWGQEGKRENCLLCRI